MKNILFLVTISIGLISNAFEVVFNSNESSEIKYDGSGEVSFLRFGIEEAFLNDTKVIVMTEGMYKSLTNKINMLTYWCEKSYKGDMDTLQGIEKWHGKKQRTIVTNNTYYLEFADGYIHEDKSGRIDPKIKFENRNKGRRPGGVERPRNRTVDKTKGPPRPVSRKPLSKAKRPTEEDISNELKSIKEDRVKNTTTTNTITVKYGPGRKVINEK